MGAGFYIGAELTQLALSYQQVEHPFQGASLNAQTPAQLLQIE
jgi:hypothetical protein